MSKQVKTRRISWSYADPNNLPSEPTVPGEQIMEFGHPSEGSNRAAVGHIDHVGTYAEAKAFVDARFARGDVEHVALWNLQDSAVYVRGMWKGKVR